MISSVGDALKTLDPVQFGKWNSYLLLKASFYESYVSDLHAPHFGGGCLSKIRDSSSEIVCCCRRIASLVRSCLPRRSVESP